VTQEKHAKLEYIGMDDNGELILDDLDKYLATGKVKLVTFSLMSNVLGTITNAEKIIEKCKAAGVLTLIDGAQAVPHMKVDIEKLGCDFFAFSGHKMLGPTGIGVLWVRKTVLETMSPFHGGGDMIREVHKYETTWNDLPYKFEAGTPNIADVVGLGSAIDYLTKIGMDIIREHEVELTKYAIEKLSAVKGLHIYGTKDISKRGNVAATSRASFYIYNTKQDIDILVNSLNIVAKVFKL
jgi:cysteine desulfurase/selenocysteine lyase